MPKNLCVTYTNSNKALCVGSPLILGAGNPIRKCLRAGMESEAGTDGGSRVVLDDLVHGNSEVSTAIGAFMEG